jgi:PTH1 family peptidyl-tRNA hydrolase
MQNTGDPPRFKIIAGLGNPGKDYEKTYHNAGFLALEHLSGSEKNSWRKVGSGWQYLKIGEKIFLRPLTFMNNSGGAVKNALAYFKVSPENLLLVHDDSDLPLGAFKLAFGRGAAGHKGVESVQKALGTKNLWRLRLGIRKKAGIKAETFVLKKMPAADLRKLYSVLDGAKLKLTLK